jgi:hypothetical protein
MEEDEIIARLKHILAGPAVQALLHDRAREIIIYGQSRLSTKDLMEAIDVDLNRR